MNVDKRQSPFEEGDEVVVERLDVFEVSRKGLLPDIKGSFHLSMTKHIKIGDV